MATKPNSKSEPKVRVHEVVTMLPAHRHKMNAEDALRKLKGKGSHPDQQAVISLIQWAREDAINDSTHPKLTEREAGYFAGAIACLREMERMLQDAHNPE